MKRKINFLPILAIVVLFFALNSYVLSGFGTLNESSLLAPFFWVFIIGLAVALFFAITQMRTNGMGKFFQIITHAFLIVFTAEVVFAFFLLVG
ncbi:MAG: metallophosphoesterase, partial [Pedobacter sp.]